jgi:hypothetical protein
MADMKKQPKTSGEGGQNASDFDPTKVPLKAQLKKQWKDGKSEAAQQGSQTAQGGSGGK